MRRALPLPLLLAALAALLAPPATARPLRTGLVDEEAFRTAPETSFARAARANASLARLSVSWRHVAPPGPVKPALFAAADPSDPAYRWGSVDAQVRRAVAAGVAPIVDVVDAPEWAQRCSDPRSMCDPDPAALAAFALAAARRYDGGYDPDGGGPAAPLPEVRFWQALNEPNLHVFFNPQRSDGDRGAPVSPLLYRELLNGFADSVKLVDPANVVISAGLGPLGGYRGVSPLAFMRRLLCMVGRRRPVPVCETSVRFDVWAIHPYTVGGPTHSARHPDDVSIGDLGAMRRLLRAAERAGQVESSGRHAAFWVTEFSWDSSPPDPEGLPAGLHARWLSEALFRMWRARVRVVVWFLLRDMQSEWMDTGIRFESGLYLRGREPAADRPKPALRAFRFPFVALRGGPQVRLWGRTPQATGGRVRVEVVRPDGRWRTLARLRAGPDGVFGRRLRAPRWLRADGRWRVRRVRALHAGAVSRPFSLRHEPDRHVRPFGS